MENKSWNYWCACWASISHIPTLKQLSDEYEIVALSTTNIEPARIAAEEFNVPHAFDNANDLVNLPEVELVVVAIKVLSRGLQK